MQVERIAALQEGLPPDIESILASWPPKPAELARILIAKYGPPQDACKTRLVWFNNGQWRTTTLYRDGIAHYWPTVHEDYLEQSIDFKVDPDLYDEISQFDGSVNAQKTSGALTARCDYEAANFLAINLARDIAVGDITADEARDIYIEAVLLYREGQAHPYMQGIMFEIPTEYQGDTDKPVF